MKPLSVLLLGCCLLAAGAASAQSPDGRLEGVTVTGSIVQERIGFIQSRLDRHEMSARRWWGGWLAAYGTLALAQGGAVALSDDDGLRKDAIVGGVGSTLGFAATLFRPMHIRWSADRLRSSSAESPAKNSLKLQRAEMFLAAAAAEEELAGSWLAHAAALSVPTASALTLWLGYDRPGPAVLNFVAGVLIGQLQIRTYPTGAVDDWNEYRARYSHARRSPPARRALAWGLAPWVDEGMMAMRFSSRY